LGRPADLAANNKPGGREQAAGLQGVGSGLRTPIAALNTPPGSGTNPVVSQAIGGFRHRRRLQTPTV